LQTEGIAHPAPQPTTFTKTKKKFQKTVAKPKKKVKKTIKAKMMKVKKVIKTKMVNVKKIIKKIIKKMTMKAPKKKKPARDSTLPFPLPMISKIKGLTALTS